MEKQAKAVIYKQEPVPADIFCPHFLINDQCFNLFSTCIKSDFTKQRLYQQRSEGGTHPETLNIHTKIDGKIFMIVFEPCLLWRLARSHTHTQRTSCSGSAGPGGSKLTMTTL